MSEQDRDGVPPAANLQQVPQEWVGTAGAPFETPAGTARLLDALLEADELELERLRSLVAPEAHAQWGDFSEIVAVLRGLGDYGVADWAELVAPDVAYVGIKCGIPPGSALTALEEGTVKCEAAYIVVNYPEHGGWLVQAIAQVSGQPQT